MTLTLWATVVGPTLATCLYLGWEVRRLRSFRIHADQALALPVPRIDPRTVFQQTLDAMPAAAGVVELGGEGR